jgi:hypothetical protein
MQVYFWILYSVVLIYMFISSLVRESKAWISLIMCPWQHLLQVVVEDLCQRKQMAGFQGSGEAFSHASTYNTGWKGHSPGAETSRLLLLPPL